MHFFLKLFNLQSPASQPGDLQALRASILAQILHGLMIFTLFIAIVAVSSALSRGLWLPALLLVSMYAWLVIVTLVKRFNYAVRVASLLGIEYLGGLVGLLSSGLSGDGRSFLFALVISATVLLGIRRGMLAMFASLVTYLVVGFGMSYGIIAIPPVEIMANSGTLIDWLSATLIFLMLGFLCLSIIGYILAGLEKNLLQEQQLEAQLREDQHNLEERVRERTQELQNEIAERQAAQESLAEMRSLMETAFEQSSAGVIIADAPALTIRNYNKAAEEILGLLPEKEPVGLGLRTYQPSWQSYDENDILLPLERLPMYRALILGEVVQSERERLVRADGSQRWVIVNGSPVRNNHGEIAGAILFFSDITEGHNAEQALKDSEERYRKLVELSPDAIAVHQQGKLVFVNPSAVKMMGATNAEELIGLPLTQVVAPEFQAIVAERVRAALQNGLPLPLMEEEFVRLDGSRVKVEVASSPCSYHDQPAVQVFVRDITQRKETETQLRQSKQELADAYEATLAGWARALELRERQTAGHSQRVVDMALELARHMGVAEEKIPHLRRGAMLHDIGKMAIPDHILLKPSSLNEEEWTIMRMHPGYAVEMLSPIPYLSEALEIPQSHHERWDGSGYPNHLKGEQIPLAARIFAVVDVWDALTSDRPYRLAWPEQETRQYLRQQSGKLFDPQVVEMFLQEIIPNQLG